MSGVTINSLGQQLSRNLVALLSLAIAVSALLYNSWRNETSEINRNWRTASFTLLQSLGKLQVATHFAHYEQRQQPGSPIEGWGHIMLIEDLSLLLPAPMPEQARQLKMTWQDNWSQLGKEDQAEATISEAIDQYRAEIRGFIASLD